MTKTSEIQKNLTNLLSSKEFSDSKRYQKLLQYLVDSTLQDITPKEITIAHDVFGKSFDFDKKNDTQVRVYIHNLRKKLDSYYQHEGKEDTITFEIPKGSYKVIFTENPSAVNSSVLNFNWKYNLAFILVIIIINVLLVLSNSDEKSTLKNHPVWQDFLKEETPILIVIGDYYLYRIHDIFDEESHLYVRDYNINSHKDFDEFASTITKNQDNIEKSNHTLLGKFAPLTVSELTKLLYANDREFDIRLSSSLQWQDLEKYNIIYIGTYKSLGIIHDLISELNFSYTVKPNRLLYDSDSLYSYESTASTIDQAYENDFSVVAKFPIANDNTILIFGSTRDIGCIATVKHLTNPKTLNSFEKEHLSEPENQFFESVFKIQGYERNVNKVDLLHFDSIKSK